MLVIDDITSLKRDVCVYLLLIQVFCGKIKRKVLSRFMKKKIWANFAQDLTFIPMLRYDSRIVWGTSVFGADAMIRMESTFKKDVPLDNILQHIPLESNIPTYMKNELVDPVVLEEWVSVYSKLKPSQVSWLATHRTRRHTYRCVRYDWNLWIFHIDRIFQKLVNNLRLKGNISQTLASFLDKEISQAAKDAEQAVSKIRNRDEARFRVIHLLRVLGKTYPLAERIRQTIELPYQVNPQIVLKAEVRKCFTTILRLYFTDLGVTVDKRVKRKPIESYLNRLWTYTLQLGGNWETRAKSLENALQQNDSHLVMRELHKLFIQLSFIERFDLWFDNGQLVLDQWV